MTVKYILKLTPGSYWNDGIVWYIYEHEKIIFSGTWEEAMTLPETVLARTVYGYETKIITTRTIKHPVWDGLTKLYLDEDSAE